MFWVHFWSIFPILGAKNFFPENTALPHTASYGFLAPCLNLEKTDKILRKHLDRRTDERTGGRTDKLFFTGSFRQLPDVQKDKYSCPYYFSLNILIACYSLTSRRMLV